MQTAKFFQSREFAEFQEKIPYRGKSFVLQEDNQNICSVIKQSLKFGKSFLWVPYSGVTNNVIFDDLARIAKEENAVFCRIEPGILEVNHENFIKCSSLPNIDTLVHEYEKLMKCSQSAGTAKIKKSFDRYTPEATLVLDLALSEEEILKQMKPKARYNIKVAERHNVMVGRACPESVEGSNHDMGDLDAFYEILAKTAKRDYFHYHPKFYYENLLQFFGEKNMVELFVAKHEGKVIAGIIVIFYGDTAIYYYGASDHEYRNLMAPYLLHWFALKEAKKRNMKYYDLFGIAPENSKNHPWQGVTEFKKKFGGQVVQYAPAFDIVYQPFWYTLYKLKHKFFRKL